MAAVPDVALLAFSVADGCAKILVPLLCFLGSGPSPRGPVADQAAFFLLLVLPMAYVSGVIVAHLAGVVLAYLHMTALIPAAALSFADLGRFVVMVFTLVSAWLLVIAVPLAAFSFFLGAGKRGTGSGFSWNMMS